MIDKNRIQNIDLARCIAISLVVFGHATHFFYGRFGVQLFFVISGYLLFKKLNSFDEKIKFLALRFLRLFPLSVFFILIFYWETFQNNFSKVINLTLMQSLYPLAESYPGGWSISCEWLFSIFMALGLFNTKKNNKIVLFFSLIFLQALASIFVFLHGGYIEGDNSNKGKLMIWLNTYNPIGNSAAFLAGMYLKEFKQKNIKVYNLFFIFFLGVIFDKKVGHFLPLQNFSIIALFLLLLKVKNLHLLKSNLIKIISQNTYGIFFWHFLVLEKLEKQAGASWNFPFLNGTLTLVISAGLAALTYQLIEIPLYNKFKKYLQIKNS